MDKDYRPTPETPPSAPVDAELRAALEPPATVAHRITERALAPRRPAAFGPLARLAAGAAVAAGIWLVIALLPADPPQQPNVALPTITNAGGGEPRLVLPSTPIRSAEASHPTPSVRIVNEATVVALIQSNGRTSLIVHGGS